MKPPSSAPHHGEPQHPHPGSPTLRRRTTLLDRVALFLATGFGVSLLPHYATIRYREHPRLLFLKYWTGAGFLGTLVGWVLAISGVPGEGLKGAAWLGVITIFSTAVAGHAETLFGRKDDPRIVIDEVVGMIWAVSFLGLGDRPAQVRALAWVLGLFLFRLFDVVKIPSRRVQRLKGGLGVMADDILSGVTANLILQALLRIG